MVITLCIFGIIGIIFLIFLSLFLYSIYKYRKGKQRGYKLFSIITGLIVIAAILAGTFIILMSKSGLEYKVEISSNSNDIESVIIPISNKENLMDQVRITTGTGQITIVETEHGSGLLVNFTNHIILNGFSERPRNSREWDLTMQNDSYDYFKEYWIKYSPSNVLDYNCSLKLELIIYTAEGADGIVFNGYLKADWNTYKFREKYY